MAHKVGRSDTFEGIAARYGWEPEALWNHGDNAELRDKRKSMDVLGVGDEVAIPPPRTKTADVETGGSYRIQAKGVFKKFELTANIDGKVLAHTPYLVSDGGARERGGVTGAAGEITEWVAAAATEVTIRINGLSITIDLRPVRPVDTEEGVRQRLVNLGLHQEGTDLEDAVLAFQEESGLPPTGEIDQATRDALVAAHGD